MVDARLYFIDMLRAIYYCHNVVKVIHRDIKPENIMINHNNEAVLIDFGISVLLDNTGEFDHNTIGTYTFYSPEMWDKKKQRLLFQKEMNDLWALGITFFKILTGTYPWDETESVMELREQILTKTIEF